MSEEIGGIGMTETSPGSPPVNKTTSDTSQDATESGISGEGDDEPYIPKSRFDEINARRKAAEEKLAEYEGVKEDELLNVRSEAEAESSKIPVDVKAIKEINALKERFELNEVRTRYPDMDKYAKQMAMFIRKNPSASWESAYKTAKFDDLAMNAKQEGRDEAYQNIGAKRGATIESPGARDTTSAKNIDELINDRNTPLSEIEKLLPRG